MDLVLLEEFLKNLDLEYKIKPASVEIPEKELVLIPESKNVFNNVSELFETMVSLESVKKSKNRLIALPFFVGMNEYDWDVLLEVGLDTIKKAASKTKGQIIRNIDFEMVPSDFNVYGLKKFIRWMDMKAKESPVFRGTNYKDYLKFFEDHLKNYQNPNLFFPFIEAKLLLPESKFLKDIEKNY